jgi:hypothetical protein
MLQIWTFLAKESRVHVCTCIWLHGFLSSFAVVTLGSDASYKTVMDRLPGKELHGQNPVVTQCNRNALNQFEQQSRKPDQAGPGKAFRDYGELRFIYPSWANGRLSPLLGIDMYQLLGFCQQGKRVTYVPKNNSRVTIRTQKRFFFNL